MKKRPRTTVVTTEGWTMIRLQLIDRADIARAMALMAIERAAATPVVLIKRNKPNDALPAGMKPRSPKTTNTERKLADLELAVPYRIRTGVAAVRGRVWGCWSVSLRFGIPRLYNGLVNFRDYRVS